MLKIEVTSHYIMAIIYAYGIDVITNKVSHFVFVLTYYIVSSQTMITFSWIA